MAGKGSTRLKTLALRVATLDTQRVKVQDVAQPGATPRQRGRAWMERRARWLREHPLCAHCARGGSARAAHVVDHEVPLTDGGADDETNYQSLCDDHHKEKTAAEASARAGKR